MGLESWVEDDSTYPAQHVRCHLLKIECVVASPVPQTTPRLAHLSASVSGTTCQSKKPRARAILNQDGCHPHPLLVTPNAQNPPLPVPVHPRL